MLELIEIQLSGVRRMAQQQADCEFLLYLLDMAILEANLKARSNGNDQARAAATKFKVVL